MLATSSEFYALRHYYYFYENPVLSVLRRITAIATTAAIRNGTTAQLLPAAGKGMLSLLLFVSHSVRASRLISRCV